MTEYMREVTKEYLSALRKTERMLKEAEHDVWQNQQPILGLYDISVKLREALYIVTEEIYQELEK